jgi:hypothetical protein
VRRLSPNPTSSSCPGVKRRESSLARGATMRFSTAWKIGLRFVSRRTFSRSTISGKGNS